MSHSHQLNMYNKTRFEKKTDTETRACFGICTKFAQLTINLSQYTAFMMETILNHVELNSL